MTGTVVNWGLGAALVIVASGALWRLAGPADRRGTMHQRADSVLHLVMAAGMAALLVERGGVVAQALGVAFGAIGVAMLARGRGHHAVMAGIMILMVHMPAGAESTVSMSTVSMSTVSMNTAPMTQPPMSAQMAMPPSGRGESLLLLAAFGYVAVSACVFTWRMRPCAVDPFGRSCEITMLVSTAVMLLPMI
jgi:hypothetical protein